MSTKTVMKGYVNITIAISCSDIHPESEVKRADVTIIGDFSVNTNQTIQVNHEYIIIKDIKESVYTLINVSRTKGQIENISKY